jgi:hypothetical protein
VADTTGTDVRRFVWAGDRAANREASARAAVELLLERVSAGAVSPTEATETANTVEPVEAAESGRA